MEEKRNGLVDVTRVVAAMGIILCHVDMTGYGGVGVLFSQFLTVRFSLMFFLAIIGFYTERSEQAGVKTVRKRVCAYLRVYGAWTMIYLMLSAVMLVLIQKVPLEQFLISKVKGFFLSGSYYHFWFYPAVIYALLFIAGVKKLLGDRALRFLMPLAVALYAAGLLGTGYLPMGRKIPLLCSLYATEAFETVMHLCCLGFPSVVFGMAAAHSSKKCSGFLLMAATAGYVAESVILCLHLGWQEDPQMLLTTPMLTVLFLHWVRDRNLPKGNVNHALLRVVSAGMYNVHPLILAATAVILPELAGLWTFLLCVMCSALFGCVLYCLRKIRFFELFI